MSRMDWVPAFNYGAAQVAAVFQQTDLPLMDPGVYTSLDVEGQIEAVPNRYFVHRIVGQVSMFRTVSPAGSFLVQECIWPGIIEDPQLSVVATPGLFSIASGANARIWWMRNKRLPGTADFSDMNDTAERWYTHIDITPKQVIDDGQIPVYSIINNAGTGPIDVTWWLRLLLTPIS